jgi:hypothetical protein
MTPKYPTKQKAVLVKDSTPGVDPPFYLRMSLSDFENDPKFQNKELSYMNVEFEIKNGKPVIYMPDGKVFEIK